MDLIAENQGRLTGLETLREMIASGRKPPIALTLDFELAEVDQGRAVFVSTPGPHAYHPIGVVHGRYARSARKPYRSAPRAESCRSADALPSPKAALSTP